MKTMLVLAATALVAAFAVLPASAQQAPSVRIRGTIEKVDGNTLMVKTRDGKSVTIKLADNARITAMIKAQLSDIKEGTFIGVTAMPQPDGSQKAIGLHLFMAAQKGAVPERHFPWDREPGSTMTNATVATIVSGVSDRTITVKYPEGEKKVIVAPNTPIVSFVPGNMGDVKVGAQMIVFAGQQQPDGSILAPAINVGRDGAAPPM